MSNGRLSAFNMSVRGSSHIENGKVCQDASAAWSDGKRAVIVVCDGHGGNDYVRSHLGAEFGCGAALKNTKAFLKTVKTEDLRTDSAKLLKNLEASIIHSWNEQIYGHLKDNPFTEEELAFVSEEAKRKYTQEGAPEEAYGTTLIAAAVTDSFWFGLHIGDGKFVTVNSDNAYSENDGTAEVREERDGVHGEDGCVYSCPVPWDDECFANVTTSMCDSNAIGKFREYCSFDMPKAVFVCTDGVDDCFGSMEQLYSFYGSVLFSFGNKKKSLAEEELLDFLPRLSAKGSGDDISIASIIVEPAKDGRDSKKNKKHKHKKKKKIRKGIKRSGGKRKKR